MKCTTCGAEFQATMLDLPFIVRTNGIVILKNVLVLQCENHPEYLIDDAVLSRIDQIRASLDSRAELEIIRYAA